jgi:hypothetical protein
MLLNFIFNFYWFVSLNGTNNRAMSSGFTSPYVVGSKKSDSASIHLIPATGLTLTLFDEFKYSLVLVQLYLIIIGGLVGSNTISLTSVNDVANDTDTSIGLGKTGGIVPGLTLSMKHTIG